MNAQTWWVFQLPGARVHVPVPDRFRAIGDVYAREVLQRDSYTGAPIASWPLLGSLVCSRDGLATSSPWSPR